MIIARARQQSLRRKILWPLIVVGSLVAVFTAWQLQRRAQEQFSHMVENRAAAIAHMVNYAAESISRPGELQRIVTSMGADSDVLDIVVVSGEPARVIASSRGRWQGKLLSELPQEEVADDLRKAMQTGRAHHHYNPTEKLFDFSTPLLLSQSARSDNIIGLGAVMVHLDTHPMSVAIRQSLLDLTLIVFVGLTVVTALGYALLKRNVLVPLLKIGTALQQDRNGSSLAWCQIPVDDEIGALAYTLRESLARANQARRDLENQKFAFDQHAIVAVTDVRGAITYVNDRFCAISGYTREELLGQTHRVVNSGTHPREFFTTMWKTIASGQVWHGEVCNRAKNGTLYWVESTIVPLLDAHGKPQAYIAIRTDISARKQTEAELKLAKEAADTANQAKSEFLATMSHEIRTPMNGVIGFTDILLETDLSPAQRHHVELLRSSGENLLVLLNDILDFSKIESGKLVLEDTPCDIKHCAQEVIAHFATQAAKKQLNLALDFSADVPHWILGDVVRLRQIIFNFVGNAIKFTPHGEIRVQGRVERDPHGSFIKISVIDTGIGLAPEQQAKLFQKFSQADTSTTRRFGGTGLGLAICKSLAECMGGSIGLESVLGQGSIFWFRVPVRLPKVAPPQPAPASPPPSAATTPTTGDTPAQTACVLIVDDTDVNLILASHFVQALGYQSETAPNGQIALNMARQKTYALILMDYHMPILDGCQATRTLRATPGPNQTTPVIGLSASLEDRDRCLASGMNGFLPKPLRRPDLKRLLDDLFNPGD